MTLPLTRRSFLGTTLGTTLLSPMWSSADAPHDARFEHVLGTSMALRIWGTASEAARGEQVASTEIARLEELLSTYRPDSEISRLGDASPAAGSPERQAILGLYRHWHDLTEGAINWRLGGRLNIDALGKAFIVDRAAARVVDAVPRARGVVLNIGGDVAIAGRPAVLDVTDPHRPLENADPIARIRVPRGGVATSGAYARPGHLIDPRTGGPAQGALAATVIAPECVTANALATALCVLSPAEGLALVERIPDTAALIVPMGGPVLRSPRFAEWEVSQTPATPAPSLWPADYEVRMALTLGSPSAGRGGGRGRGGLKAPYVAIWVENAQGKAVRTVAVWGDKWRYLADLVDWWALARNTPALNTTATRATRPAGSYTVLWNGKDDQGAPVPRGTYKINIEVVREHGTYARRSGTIVCGDVPSTITLTESSEFAPVVISYGPRSVAS